MKRVLIVCPQFVPINAADMQRVRMTMGYFQEFGWKPSVLAVGAEFVEGVADPMLARTISEDVPVVRTKALPARWTRKFGLGNLGLRSLPFLYAEGKRLIEGRGIDLVYFSTTIFPAMTLGRFWKNSLGVPFVIDMQDPWLSDYHESQAKADLPPKYWISGRLDRVLEPWTMKAVGGLIAVSEGYISTLRKRYSWLSSVPAEVIPFGAAEDDFDVVSRYPQPNAFFRAGEPDRIHGVYVGRGGRDMAASLRILFRAFKQGLDTTPEAFGKVRLHFIGTDYAVGSSAKETVMPVARECGVGEYVEETPQRVPYFQALQLLKDSDFLIVPGSDDPQYTASKIFPYVLARKPLLCAFQDTSSVCGLLRRTRAGSLVTFARDAAPDGPIASALQLWREMLKKLPYHPPTDWDEFAPFTARRTAEAQCRVFDRVIHGELAA